MVIVKKNTVKLLHVGVHNNIGNNLGDKIHFSLLRAWFNFWSKKKIIWTKRQVWKEFKIHEIEEINNEFDGIIIGGGGLFLQDQNSESSKASGWQLNIKANYYKLFKIPIFLFAVGFNKFRKQKNFNKKFKNNINDLYKSCAFFSLRNFGSIKKIKELTNIKEIAFQPCVTSYLNKFYKICKIKKKKIVSIGFAGDRIKFRFKDIKQIHFFIYTLEELIKFLKKKNYEIHFLYHKNIDSYYEKYFRKEMLNKVKILNFSNISIKKTIEYYKKISCLFAMRGHHQLISLGCETPFFSMITHDKIKFLVKENKLDEFSADINRKNFKKKIYNFINSIDTKIFKLKKKLSIINNNFYNISRKNIIKIFKKI